MSEKKPCVRCNRNIDAAAKSCLYCNWWQAEAPPARVETSAADAAPAAPERRWSRKILGALAFAALVIIAFVIGSLVHGFEPSEIKAAQQPKTPAATVPVAPATAPPQSNVALVPDTSAPATQPGQPMAIPPDTASNGSMMSGQQPPSDATAMTAEQYGAAVQRQQPPGQQPQSIDPRSLTGPAYQQGSQAMPERTTRPRRPQTAQAATHVVTTQPVAEYQPVPSLRGHGRARLALTVGPDGRVKDIDVIDSISGEMGRLIGAVQSWRFRPATQNGVPVTSRFTVDINVE